MTELNVDLMERRTNVTFIKIVTSVLFFLVVNVSFGQSEKQPNSINVDSSYKGEVFDLSINKNNELLISLNVDNSANDKIVLNGAYKVEKAIISQNTTIPNLPKGQYGIAITNNKGVISYKLFSIL